MDGSIEVKKMYNIEAIVKKYNNLLYMEENNTIKYQFNNFTNEYLSTPQHDELYGDFMKFIDTLDDNDLEINQKVLCIVKSPFFEKVLTFKNNAREKELRRLTINLSDFIRDLGHNRGNVSTHPQNIVSRIIKDIANEIEPRKLKGPKISMNDAWRDTLISETEKRFK